MICTGSARYVCVCICVTLFTTCGERPVSRVPADPSGKRPVDHQLVDSTPNVAEDRIVTGDSVYRDSAIIVVTASDAEIEAARKTMKSEEFADVADDLSYYRGTAFEYLDKLARPYTVIQGRRPLKFMVDGAVQERDFKDVELFDFIILYAPNRPPRILATNEVDQLRDFS